MRTSTFSRPALESVEDLSKALGLDLPELRAFTEDDASSYRHFTVPKHNGCLRTIGTPTPKLMAAQRWILRHVVEPLPGHDASHAFRKGRSTVTNAAAHVGASIILKVDLRDFFPSVTLPRVAGVFRWAGYPEGVVDALARLCTAPDAFGVRRLPQGAPTSPGLANAACYSLDRRLTGLGDHRGWRYTRYADDLTFSLPSDAGEGAPDALLRAIEAIVRDEDFTPHPHKTRVARDGARLRVTGLVINGPGAPRLPRELRRQLRAAVHNLEQSPHPEGETVARLTGFAAHVQESDRPLGLRLRARIAAVGKEGAKT